MVLLYDVSMATWILTLCSSTHNSTGTTLTHQSGTEWGHPPCPLALHQRWQLVVVPDQDKDPGVPQGAQADRQRDLGGLVHDAVVKGAMREERMRDSETRGSHHRLKRKTHATPHNIIDTAHE